MVVVNLHPRPARPESRVTDQALALLLLEEGFLLLGCDTVLLQVPAVAVGLELLGVAKLPRSDTSLHPFRVGVVAGLVPSVQATNVRLGPIPPDMPVVRRVGFLLVREALPALRLEAVFGLLVRPEGAVTAAAGTDFQSEAPVPTAV